MPFASIAVIAALAAALSPVGGSRPDRAVPRGGLTGLVLRGPTMPACRESVPCDEPAADLTLLFLRDGKLAARTRTSRDGRYRVRLRPGRYAVRTTQPAFGRVPKPSTVTAPRNRFSRVDFFVDTGIR